jgi:hypothetical protein
MPPDELARANRRLAGAESFTIAPSKYLGHYVAGNLAARHNINVTLHNSPGHGITATINLPPTLLTTEPVAAGQVGPADAAVGAPSLSSTPTLTARRDMTPQQAVAGMGPAPGGGGRSEPLAVPAAHSGDLGGGPAPALVPLDPGPLTPLPPAPSFPGNGPGAPGGPGGPGGGYPGGPGGMPESPPMPGGPGPQGPAPLFPPLPAASTHDLQLEPLPPSIDPAIQNTQPIYGLDTGGRPPLEDPAAGAPHLAPLPPASPGADLPLLSAPHLRVQSPPGRTTGQFPAVRTTGQVPAVPPTPPQMPMPPPGSSVFPPAAPGSGLPPLAARPGGPGARPSDAAPDRTTGGLVKRSPRGGAVGTGLSAGSGGGSTQPARPSDDLLQTLATYTTHLHRQINPTPPPGTPAVRAGGPGTFPPFNPTPPPGTPIVRPGGPPAPGMPGPLGGGPALPSRGGHGTPTTHATSGEHTASGLARRVAGAQMPRTQPLGLRRQQQGPATPAPLPPSLAGRPPVAAGAPSQDHRRGNESTPPPRDVTSSDTQRDPRSPKDVYSFLSSFSAGVQRGLDEARNPNTSEEDQ